MSAPDDDFDDEIALDSTPCQSCGAGHTYTRECWDCGGEGAFDGYEDDPLWYQPGEYETCGTCNGRGFFHWCRACGNDVPASARRRHAEEKRAAEERNERQGDLPL